MQLPTTYCLRLTSQPQMKNPPDAKLWVGYKAQKKRSPPESTPNHSTRKEDCDTASPLWAGYQLLNLAFHRLQFVQDLVTKRSKSPSLPHVLNDYQPECAQLYDNCLDVLYKDLEIVFHGFLE